MTDPTNRAIDGGEDKMTPEQARARIAELEAKNADADGWGAAVGARWEEIKSLRYLASLTQSTPQAMGGEDSERNLNLADQFVAEHLGRLGLPDKRVRHIANCIAELLDGVASPAPSSAKVIETLKEALRETTREAEEHRRNIVEAKHSGFQNIDDPKYRDAYDKEVARFDALIERARNALADDE